jgi:hypothetical protein
MVYNWLAFSCQRSGAGAGQFYAMISGPFTAASEPFSEKVEQNCEFPARRKIALPGAAYRSKNQQSPSTSASINRLSPGIRN